MDGLASLDIQSPLISTPHQPAYHHRLRRLHTCLSEKCVVGGGIRNSRRFSNQGAQFPLSKTTAPSNHRPPHARHLASTPRPVLVFLEPPPGRSDRGGGTRFGAKAKPRRTAGQGQDARTATTRRPPHKFFTPAKGGMPFVRGTSCFYSLLGFGVTIDLHTRHHRAAHDSRRFFAHLRTTGHVVLKAPLSRICPGSPPHSSRLHCMLGDESSWCGQ